MPKRVIDFDAMWASDKLASCADWAQAEYAWFYGLADASGSFELTNLRVIWGRVAAIRKTLTIERLTQVFEEFMQRGLLFTWEENGKRYGHWTGSDVPGRLPAPSWRMRLERLAPPVPREKLFAYMARFGGRPLAGNVAHATRTANTSEITNTTAETACVEITNNTQTKNEESAQLELKLGLEDTQAQDLSLGLDLDLEKKKEERQVCLSASQNVYSTPKGIAEPCGLPEQMFAIYEVERGALPEALRWNEERRRQCMQRLEEGLTLEEFRAAVRRAAATPFLSGAGERGWRASFDWFVSNPTNVRKVLEGRYDAPSVGAAVRTVTASARGVTGAHVGAGPIAAAFGARVKPAALERIRARDRANEEARQVASLRERAS